MRSSGYQINQRTYCDFEERAMIAQGRTFEFCKLDNTPFIRKTFALLSSDFVLTRSSYSCRLKLEGDNPSGMLAFGIPAHSTVRMNWHGRLVEGSSNVLILPAHSALHAVIDPGFDLFTITFSEEVFTHKAELLGYPDLRKRINQLDALSCNPGQMNHLRILLNKMARESSRPHWDIHPYREQILIQLINSLGSFSPQSVPFVSSITKRKAIQETERYVLAHPDEAPKIKDLCEVIGVSKRTLDYAFNECFGIAPKTYISSLRLNAVHKILRTQTSDLLRISDAANAWGYWHMGQFAADYRRLFGELPSETLGGTCRSIGTKGMNS